VKPLVVVLLILLSIVLAPLGGEVAVRAQAGRWSEPVNISNRPGADWFPDIAVDGQGYPHVVWCGTNQERKPGDQERVFYTAWTGSTWLAPNDLVRHGQRIKRNALALGQNGDLFLAYREEHLAHDGVIRLFSAQASEAWSAAAWSSPRIVSAHGHSYMVDLAVDSQGTLHLLFDDRGYPVDDVCVGGCADIYYRYSTDDGQTWSIPRNLSQSLVGSSRGQLKVDPSGRIHVTWDDGWDRLEGAGVPTYSVYRNSADGGITWSTPITVAYPTTGTAQLVSGADGQGGVMLVWRTTSHDEVFCQWSTDHGESWSSPRTVPGIYARPWAIPFDLYDLATDSVGHIHLLVVGREIPMPQAPVGLYLVWDGHSWSEPRPVYSGAGFPEYPRLAISEGNHLHAVWFVRDSLWERGDYEVWYSEAHSAAPHQTLAPSETPLPTVTATPSPTYLPVPTAEPRPTLPPHGQLPPDLYTETDQVLQLALALSPLPLVLLLAYAFRRARR